MSADDGEADVPYGNDWHDVAEAAAWVDAADRRRPWRAQFRDLIATHVGALAPGAHVLELGSGPGLLAERVLQRCPRLARYTLLDFSPPMLALSRERLGRFSTASFVHDSFKSEGWCERVIGPFDCILSMQAIHEIRHKRHVPGLYRELHGALAPEGQILICDHTPLDDTSRSAALYMTQTEQLSALSAAGFASPRVLLAIDTLVLYTAQNGVRRVSATSNRGA